jgi:hypothetical protein
MGYWYCAPGKNYYALLPEAAQTISGKRNVQRQVGHVFMTCIVVGILIFSKNMMCSDVSLRWKPLLHPEFAGA